MLAGIGFAICVLTAIGLARIAKTRRMRTMDKSMRDYVRRTY